MMYLNKLLIIFAFLFTISGCGDDSKQKTSSSCGNNIINPEEECDGTALGSTTCDTLGLAGTGLSCNSDCTFNTASCSETATCGNGILEDNEECEPALTMNLTCEESGFTTGTITCSQDCSFDLSECSYNSVKELQTPIKISSMKDGSCSIDSNGKLWCWGANFNGIIGTSPLMQINRPTQIMGHHQFTKLSLNMFYSCGIDERGILWCWGQNDFGQLGITEFPELMEPTNGLNFPVAVNSYVGEAVSISTAYAVEGCMILKPHTSMVNSNGELWNWGDNSNNIIGENGGVFSTHPIKLASTQQFTTVSTSGVHSCALNLQGHAWCWGAPENGTLGSISDPDLAITGAGTPVEVLGGHQFTDIACGGQRFPSTCGITEDGTGFCWGSNINGALGSGLRYTGDGGTLSWSATPLEVVGHHHFTSIGNSGNTVCGITDSTEVWCWGQIKNMPGITVDDSATPLKVNFESQKTIVKLSMKEEGIVYGVDSDGAIWKWGQGAGGSSEALVDDSHYYTDVVGNISSWCGKTAENIWYCMGSNQYGHLGNLINSTIPGRYPVWSNKTFSVVNYESSRLLAAIDTEGHPVCRTSDGTDVTLNFPHEATLIKFTGEHSLIVDSDGKGYIFNDCTENTIFTEIENISAPIKEIVGTGLLLDIYGKVWSVDFETGSTAKIYSNHTFASFTGFAGVDFRNRVLIKSGDDFQIVEGFHNYDPGFLASSGYFSCVVSKEGGAILCFDENREITIHSNGGNTMQISLGNGYICTLPKAGSQTPACKSIEPLSNNYGQLGNGTYTDTFNFTNTKYFSDLLEFYNLN